MKKNIIVKKIQLDGLSCTACETKIENKVGKIAGVEKVQVNYSTSVMEITYDETQVTMEAVKKVIEKAGYGMGLELEEKSEKNNKSDKITISQFITILLLLFCGYILIQNTIGFNFIPEVDSTTTYGILFIVGLLTSFHCVAMCGGINLSVCMSPKFLENSKGKFGKFLPSFLYNLGRVVSYTIIGGIIGAIGSVFQISAIGKAAIAIIAGIFMLIMGLNLLNLFGFLRKFNPHMPKAFAKIIHGSKKNKGPFIVGLLNGLMPCGPLQAMQIYALGTGSFIAGALSMMIFSLGTVPLMFLFGALGSVLSSKFTKNLLKLSGVLVIFLGFVMFGRGLAFVGVTSDMIFMGSGSHNTADIVSEENTDTATEDSSMENSDDSSTTNTETSEEVQEITTYLKPSEYEPITVKAGIPVVWTIIAEADTLTGCNSVIIIPEYNIQQELVEGENVITFTPTKAGVYGYSCWMGMITSSITVEE